MEKNNEPTQSSGSADMASNVPNVPSLECDLPATSRVEIYSPGNGHAHSRLDGVNYVCAQHLEHHLEVLSWDNGDGYTHHVVKLPEDVERRCGTGFDFVAMRRTESAAGEATESEVLAAYQVGREIGEKSVVAYRDLVDDGLRRALERIGGKLAELRELKAQHAFTVTPDDTELDTWHWSCRCGGFAAVQLPPYIEHDAPIGMRLVAHIAEAGQ